MEALTGGRALRVGGPDGGLCSEGRALRVGGPDGGLCSEGRALRVGGPDGRSCSEGREGSRLSQVGSEVDWSPKLESSGAATVELTSGTSQELKRNQFNIVI